jgi:hypothetical protein
LKSAAAKGVHSQWLADVATAPLRMLSQKEAAQEITGSICFSFFWYRLLINNPPSGRIDSPCLRLWPYRVLPARLIATLVPYRYHQTYRFFQPTVHHLFLPHIQHFLALPDPWPPNKWIKLPIKKLVQPLRAAGSPVITSQMSAKVSAASSRRAGEPRDERIRPTSIIDLDFDIETVRPERDAAGWGRLSLPRPGTLTHKVTTTRSTSGLNNLNWAYCTRAGLSSSQQLETWDSAVVLIVKCHQVPPVGLVLNEPKWRGSTTLKLPLDKLLDSKFKSPHTQHPKLDPFVVHSGRVDGRFIKDLFQSWVLIIVVIITLLPVQTDPVGPKKDSQTFIWRFTTVTTRGRANVILLIKYLISRLEGKQVQYF